MSRSIVRGLRVLTALLTGASGTGQIAALWFRDLSDAALLDALCGSVYLILALGLLGSARFSLILGIVIPTALATWQWPAAAALAPAAQLRLAVDLAVPPMCALLLLAGLRRPT